MQRPLLIWFADIDHENQLEHTSHARQLGKLTQAGLPVLPGFVITSAAFHDFLEQNRIKHNIQGLLGTIDFRDTNSVAQVSQHIKDLISKAHIPQQIEEEIAKRYLMLQSPVRIHVHSGKQNAFKHHSSDHVDAIGLLDRIKKAWREHFNTELLLKRHTQKADHLDSGSEIIVQVTIEPDLTGTVSTVNTESDLKSEMVVTIQHGHGFDTYILSKKYLDLIRRDIKHHAKGHAVTLDQLDSVGKLAKEVEKQLFFPQEITWAVIDDSLVILETKPLTSSGEKKHEKKKKVTKAKGTPITKQIRTGVVHIMTKPKELATLNRDTILIADKLSPKDIQKLTHIQGLILESGERHSELATILRAKGIPAIFHVNDATKQFKQGQHITIDTAKGDIYSGGIH